MKPFTDKEGRTWAIVLNVSAVKRVRDVLGVDLLDVANDDLLSRLADDPCLLVDVLYVLSKPEADAKGVTDEDFGRGMVGGVLDDAASALMKELLDFFPSAQRARALGKLLKVLEAQDAAMKAAAEAVKSICGDASANSPASAASTPAA